VKDLRVAEPENRETKRFEDCGARCIPFDPLRVNLSIDLHDQAPIGAVEIDDEAADDVLAPEAQAVQLPPSQSLPKDSLRVRGTKAHPLGQPTFVDPLFAIRPPPHAESSKDSIGQRTADVASFFLHAPPAPPAGRGAGGVGSRARIAK
jgi:hypothetical protein